MVAPTPDCEYSDRLVQEQMYNDEMMMQNEEEGEGEDQGNCYEDEENLFILSVTLSNNKTYLVEVKKNLEAEEIAERFCNDN
jgi:hypothetical protein